MMRNAYVDLCLSVQATRRDFEGICTPLATALGVAASTYTHQLANVLRVLTDVRVRHLLADEVGLGKTVQTLMVLNALRSQRRDLKALVVVPDQLVSQWRDEIMTRAHTAPLGDDECDDFEEGGQYIRLAWEAQLRMTDDQGNPRLTLSDVDPSRFDVLIVDELHRLGANLQDRIVRVAADFEHVLVLTATPAFQRVKRHAQLFALLEPERTAISRRRVAMSERGRTEKISLADDLSKWPEWAAEAVVDDFVDRDRATAEAYEEAELPAAAMARCAYRRFIRTRRADYSGILPVRCHQPLVVEPLGAEAERQALMWRYFGYLKDLSRRFDPVLLAKRVILSPPSLEQRVDFLRRKGHERGGLLEQVKPLVHRSQGDSRADALVDLLAKVWSRDPSERVLVAAQDNLTVDYLFDLVQARLPVIGPIHDRVPLVAARVRQGMMTEAMEDLGGFGNETNENLELFQGGEAQVLFAPETVQVGLNLQCARVLVLYSVPWRPEEVEQWIGRLDRIGNSAAFSRAGEAKTIDVYTIVQRGLVDEKVVAVLQRFQVFERSVNLDGEHLEEVAQIIEAAALRTESVNWGELEKKSEKMAEEDEVQELESSLRPYLPWTVSSAMRGRDWLETMSPAPLPLVDLPEHCATGPRSWERAFEGMLKLLKRAGDYHIRWNQEPNGGTRFQSLWYRFGEPGMYGRRDVYSRVVFSFGADPGHERSPRHAHAFVTRRSDIGTPPRRSVTMSLNQEEVRRPLRFLSFGDALHDELVSGWLHKSDDTLMMDVYFPKDHAIWEYSTSALYVLRISVLDPATPLLERGVEDRTLNALTQAASHTSIRSFAKALRFALEADVRWLRAQLPAKMNVEARRQQGHQWVCADADETRALLNPMAHQNQGFPRATGLRATNHFVGAAKQQLHQMRSADSARALSAWSHRLPEFERHLNARLLVIREEAQDAISIATQELRNAEGAVAVAKERGNRAQIARTEDTRDATARGLRMTEVLWQNRELWLQECVQEIRSVLPRERLTALINAQRA